MSSCVDKEINLPKMKELIKAWEKEYKRLEDIKQTDLEHLKFVKINAKALQLKYCIKALKKQLLIHSVVSTCCEEIGEGFFLGTTCPKCKRPFRQVIE